ncbi:TPA: helix-turn-helix transcriptional regulator [Salmonella enterica]|uniref:Helix-turn-helix transcriptional regulator n=1 Tax=Salmonella enterica TaxID=28901 RepID=A0A750BAB2_SALER|nr:hypothetical protein [Salmonella enterica subsp. enterica serovar Halle]HAF1519715.1 helix-turn-helix transcriptional regulator [Salmonella enterica]HAF6120468.1 helix-turn-helix transcriptional regulator [Salmonella enterica]
MLKQHLIFLVSPCEYLHRGLESLMSDSPVRIIRVSRPEEITAHPVSSADNRLVLVSLPSMLSTAVAGRMFLWRLSVLRSQGAIPGRLSCLLMGDRKRWDDPAGGYDWLPCRDVLSVRETLLRILEWPERLLRPVRLPLPLSPRQREILDGTLAKKTVSQIARELGVTDRAVFASRRTLMTKMGLRNRMDLMGLADGGTIGVPSVCTITPKDLSVDFGVMDISSVRQGKINKKSRKLSVSCSSPENLYAAIRSSRGDELTNKEVLFPTSLSGVNIRVSAPDATQTADNNIVLLGNNETEGGVTLEFVPELDSSVQSPGVGEFQASGVIVIMRD